MQMHDCADGNGEAAAVEMDRPRQCFWSWGGLACAAAAVCLMGAVAALLLPALVRYHNAARVSLCRNNLEQWGQVFKMYADENRKEKFPPGVCVDGIWTVDLRNVYPAFLADPTILICRDSRGAEIKNTIDEALAQDPPDWDTLHRLLAEQYVYLPWFIQDEAAFWEWVQHPDFADLPPDEDFSIGEQKYFGLREGVARFYITEIMNPVAYFVMSSTTPVAFDNPGTVSHTPTGINVLYLDGHVEFLPYGSGFPANQEVWDYFTDKMAALGK